VESFGGCDTPEIADCLREGRFDACLVSGWYLKSYVQAIRACWQHGVKVLVRGDSTLKTERPLLARTLKHFPYRWFLTRIDAHLYVGSANRAYLRAYGVPERSLFFAPHFVDNAFFASRSDSARRTGLVRRLRREVGVPDEAVVFLFVGKFMPHKRVLDFVEALGALAKNRTQTYGVAVGSGPLDRQLRDDVTRRGVPLAFVGFRNQSELAAYYALADALVLPSSRESWGLVANEAMACGLPVIVSDAAGCADDLADGVAGVVFPAGDRSALVRTMEAMVERVRVEGSALRDAARRKIESYSMESATNGLVAALASVTGRSAREWLPVVAAPDGAR
jgi:glycosyltransferase involved in cell wall biosynthesis